MLSRSCVCQSNSDSLALVNGLDPRHVSPVGPDGEIAMPDSHPNLCSPRRSRAWFDTPELYGWLRTAALRSHGLTPDAIADRPIIGICNTWSELTHCNAHLRQLAEAVRRGVWQAGGLPLEFPVLSTGEFNMRPTAMLFRNLASMDVEEAIRANP